jgi:hypothetical protein
MLACRVRRGFRTAASSALASLWIGAAALEAGVAELYDYDAPGSFLSGLEIEDPGPEGSQGFDLNGDKVADNALGAIFASLGPLLGIDINAVIAESIETGDFRLGAAWPTLRGGLANASDVPLHFLNLEDPDQNLATVHEFLVDRSSFVPGTADPVYVFPGGRLMGSAFSTGPADFPLTLSLGDIVLNLNLRSVLIEGALATDASGIIVMNGRLGGVVTLQNLYEAFNAFLLSDTCDCLGISAPVITFDPLADEWVCAQVDGSGCAPDTDGETCGTIVEFCQFAVATFGNAADVDTDEDGDPDALSIYMTFSMVGTDLLGPAGPLDCNENGIPDLEDIESGALTDADGDGYADECVEPGGGDLIIKRGDVNGDGAVPGSTVDILYYANWAFLGQAPPPCRAAADANGDGQVGGTTADIIFLASFLFLGAAPPPAPFPGCGPATPADVALGCETPNC